MAEWLQMAAKLRVTKHKGDCRGLSVSRRLMRGRNVQRSRWWKEASVCGPMDLDAVVSVSGHGGWNESDPTKKSVDAFCLCLGR